ncbi:hypothetical protein [Neorhizobium tomejilense]|uniref:hypothetical protein n=1 Tax=Neorhizobium tomejilense TaxID=2093828 RepID=UPI000CF99C8D|nr:hypothetical protein [Neorhizobium tomejilense]
MENNELVAVRLLDRPIIVPAMSPRIGTNINGPSLIRVPSWVERPLGRYYLYFAHHRGDHIRLAYADRLTGPWIIYEEGTLPLSKSGFTHHLASPEIVIDHEKKQFRMFFHGGDEIKNQFTRLAISPDGIHFTAQPDNLMNPYARLFTHGPWVYAITMPGQIYRSSDGISGFSAGPMLFTRHMRHSAVWIENNVLHVVYSNRGDAPECLLYAQVRLDGEWLTWREGPSRILLGPERDWEGGRLPIEPSVIGPADEPVRQLRDPAVYEEDGRRYLIYSVAGEAGLALAEIHTRKLEPE